VPEDDILENDNSNSDMQSLDEMFDVPENTLDKILRINVTDIER
jgi:hypothetical protein